MLSCWTMILKSLGATDLAFKLEKYAKYVIKQWISGRFYRCGMFLRPLFCLKYLWRCLNSLNIYVQINTNSAQALLFQHHFPQSTGKDICPVWCRRSTLVHSQQSCFESAHQTYKDFCYNYTAVVYLCNTCKKNLILLHGYNGSHGSTSSDRKFIIKPNLIPELWLMTL